MLNIFIFSEQAIVYQGPYGGGDYGGTGARTELQRYNCYYEAVKYVIQAIQFFAILLEKKIYWFLKEIFLLHCNRSLILV